MTITRTPVAARRPLAPSMLARQPELLPIAGTTIAWVIIAVSPLTAWIGNGEQATHAVHDSIFSLPGIGMVAVMTVAMMGPMAIPGVRTVAFNSLWSRGGRATVWFFGSFLAAWTVIAICLTPIANALGGALGSAPAAAGILALLCALAQFDPDRVDQAKGCDRPMRLRSNGSDANVDCARFGTLSAARGVRLCALPMLAMLAVMSSILVMALLTALLIADRVTEGRRRMPIAALYAIIGVILLVWAQRG